ncbi:type II CRISPR-associated endonuclease Cas1 [Microbacter margulisiae]|uniref:CRISPR-associated endonuclease Cas1 n=1 Tax=Microbacter margulisiae TaxID=1350067 RepID=A0A7W5DQ82_9PORP|nr:type II CRISPR-associated endonuclease Cas1 [Microbacter margulisiae]MBB3186564.1 CRISPR-associated protein Cas1 [Microbacter margulisiae]
MIKRTLYFGNPAYLSKRNEQLVIKLPEVAKNDTLPESFKQKSEVTVPIEDIGVVVLDHQQITLTHGLMDSLLSNNAAVITCDGNRMPAGLLLPLSGNTTQRERWHDQIEASEPLKKQLWQQTIKAKIHNQTALLERRRDVNTKNMHYWSDVVKSGDVENHEARAAAYYWSNLFPSLPDFRRGREEEPPNNLLNYGYAILRAVVARSLVSSGLLPTFGIHHRNRYNAYCLADDVMEPYRPYVDDMVYDIVDKGTDYRELTKDIKQRLLQIPTIEVVIEGERSPLMVGVQRTTASLYRCFSGELRKISYPTF